jgi:hypothetical protein
MVSSEVVDCFFEPIFGQVLVDVRRRGDEGRIKRGEKEITVWKCKE